MDAEYANYYTREVMLILIREFQSPDEEMKKIVLKVRKINSCSAFVTPALFLFTVHKLLAIQSHTRFNKCSINTDMK